MKNLAKFAAGGILIALVALGVLFGIRYLRYRNDPAYQNEQAAYEYVEQEKKLIQQMKDDPYGGETPEETLRLFIDALKKGDTDLASRYFVVDKQEQQEQLLNDLKQKLPEFEKYATEISVATKSDTSLGENMVQFEYVSSIDQSTKIENSNFIIPAGKIRNSITLQKIYNRWKITD